MAFPRMRESLENEHNLLWQQRHKLDQQIYEADRALREVIIEAGANYVGKAFKRPAFKKGDKEYWQYAILVAAPYPNWHNTVTSPNFNEYQIPALVFVEGKLEYPEFETVFTGVLPEIEGVRKGHAMLDGALWVEIPREEFLEKLNEHTARLFKLMANVSMDDRARFEKRFT